MLVYQFGLMTTSSVMKKETELPRWLSATTLDASSTTHPDLWFSHTVANAGFDKKEECVKIKEKISPALMHDDSYFSKTVHCRTDAVSAVLS